MNIEDLSTHEALYGSEWGFGFQACCSKNYLGNNIHAASTINDDLPVLVTNHDVRKMTIQCQSS